MSTIFIWDGTHLGNMKDLSIKVVENNRYKNYSYWVLEYQREFIYVVYHKSNTRIPCLIDEAKQIFGLKKTGTHSIIKGNTNYIIYFIRNYPVIRLLDIDFDLSDDQKKEITKIISFRSIFSLSNSETLITYRSDNFLSFTSKIEEDPSIPQKIYIEWLEDIESLSDILTEDLKIDYVKDMLDNLFEIMIPENSLFKGKIFERLNAF